VKVKRHITVADRQSYSLNPGKAGISINRKSKGIKDNKETIIIFFNMRIIYLLELANSKFFLLVRREPVLDIPRFFLESVLKYDYLKTHKPIRIINKFDETHPLDLDILVKKEMLARGIDNVRGGSYSTLFLNEHQTSLLNIELFPTTLGPETACSDEVIKEILDKYGAIQSEFERKNILEQLKKNYAKYQKEKNDKNVLEQMCSFSNVHRCKCQLNWISDKCHEQITAQRETVLYKILNKDDVKIYREILPMFNTIYQTFMTYYEKPIDKVYTDVLIKHPEFVLDDFMYNGHRTHLPASIENVERLVFIYSFFLTFIENRINELKFDVSSWGDNAEQIFPRAIYFLDL